MTEPLLIGPDRAGRMVAVVDGLVAARAPAGARGLACPEGEIGPGAVCAHTHLYSGLAPYGMPTGVVAVGVDPQTGTLRGGADVRRERSIFGW